MNCHKFVLVGQERADQAPEGSSRHTRASTALNFYNKISTVDTFTLKFVEIIRTVDEIFILCAPPDDV